VLAAAELLLAGEVASAQARADARTADAGLAVVALQAKAALTGVERVLGAGDVVNRRLTALGKRQDELAENQKRVEAKLDDAVAKLAARRRDRAALPASAGPAPGRAPIPPGQRPWALPQPATNPASRPEPRP
ncbi:hypothetical protein BU198_34320, partial [Streptomyces sp. CBMA156]|nr:hypothetical protein [Streptomyces sp. CBMA156]